MKESYFHIERKICLFLKIHSIRILRWAVGILYFWYGLLKVLDISPAEELVYQATHWIGMRYFVELLGVWEMIIGLCLFTHKFLRVGLILLFLQFPGTFLPLFLNPEDYFTVIPYGLTLKGQYVFKNLVLLSSALVLLGSLHSKNGHK